MNTNTLVMLADVAGIDKEGSRGAKRAADNLQQEELDLFLFDKEDHAYSQHKHVFDIVNVNHDYYQKLEQTDSSTGGGVDHSYAFHLPKEDLHWDAFEDTSNIVPEVFNCYWADCDFGSMQKSDLVEHLTSTHLKVAGVRRCEWRGCSKADRSYAQKCILSRHVKSDHLQLREHACTYCGTCFASKERMVLHIRALHESEVKYSCSECHRLFRTTAERRHHVVRAHEKNRRECSQCGKTYSGRDSLRRHEQICSRMRMEREQCSLIADDEISRRIIITTVIPPVKTIKRKEKE